MKTQNSKRKAQIHNLSLKTFYFLLGFLTFNFLLSTFHLGQATAQTILPLTVAPARQQLTVNPGEETAVNIKFFNTGDTPVSGFVKVADFVVSDNQGTPRIIEDVSQANPKFSASTWLSLPYDRITIAANDRISFQAKIKVPADARPGGRYVAVYFESTSSLPQPVGAEQEAGTGISHRLASLIYLRVAGDTFEKALISRFFIPSFFEYGPIKVTTEILNRGDYHIQPRGVLTMTNLFGATIDQVSLKEENIFPDTSREYKNELGQKWMLGKYKVSLNAGYGEKGQALTATAYVWVFPWRIATIIALNLIILFLLGRHFYLSIIKKEAALEEEIERERKEIERLKEELRKKKE